MTQTTEKAATVWTESFRVHSYETDPGGTASLTSICNYLQEAAGNHADRLGVSIEQLAERNLTWVLARLRVEMDALPAWHEEVVVETWPSGADRLFATREFVIHDGAGAVVGRASSAWLMIDRARRRPIRMPDFIKAFGLPNRPRPVDHVPDRLPDVGDGATEESVRVRYSDLDVNAHVNNVRYAEWSLEAVPIETLNERVVRTLDLHFLAEGTYGDTVTVRSKPMSSDDDHLIYGHVILHEKKELARARTVWVPR